MNVLLLSRWKTLCGRLALHDKGLRCFKSLCALYGSSARHYHDLNHIHSLLAELRKARMLANRPDLVELALWYHDAVYDTHARDNEKRSAGLAYKQCVQMGLPVVDARNVGKLIMWTTHAGKPKSKDAQLLVDCDLSLLGAASKRYRELSEMVRREYAWVPEKMYRLGRVSVLKALLNRRRIYCTEYFFEKYEKTARKNLLAEIEFLKT